jgi:hypothetical protein
MIKRLHVATRYSEAAIFNGVVYLAGQVPTDLPRQIRTPNFLLVDLKVGNLRIKMLARWICMFVFLRSNTEAKAITRH